MESQPQNPEFRINPETFTHAFFHFNPFLSSLFAIAVHGCFLECICISICLQFGPTCDPGMVGLKDGKLFEAVWS